MSFLYHSYVIFVSFLGAKPAFRAEEGPEQHPAADDGREPEVRGAVAPRQRNHQKLGRPGNPTRGQCYDHQFVNFDQFFCLNLAVFSKML
jgi:hypothetical protein